MSMIHSIVYQPGPSEHTPPYHYNRVPIDCANLIAGHGIEGDYKAGHNPNRHVNIMSLEALRTLAQEGWKVAPGQLGEQITVSGLDVAALPPGTRISLGESAIVEVQKQRTGCEWLAAIQDKNPEEAAGRLGVLVSVVQGGSVCRGGPVSVIETTEQEQAGV